MKNISALITFIKLLYHNRHMIMLMALRDLKSKYIGSVFGLTWAVLDPIVQISIFGIVFGVIFNAKPDPIYKTDNYFVYLVCGLIPWQFFSQAVSQSTTIIMDNKTLIKKSVNFPSEILQIVKLISLFINHLIGICILIIIVFIFTKRFPYYFPIVFIYTFCVFMFSTGIGWIVSSFNTYLKDVQQVVGLVLLAWMYFTPILYSPTLIPETYQIVWQLNPLYYLVIGFRYVLLADRALPLTGFLYFAGVSVFTFAVGGIIFKKLKPGFAEEL